MLATRASSCEPSGMSSPMMSARTGTSRTATLRGRSRSCTHGLESVPLALLAASAIAKMSEPWARRRSFLGGSHSRFSNSCHLPKPLIVNSSTTRVAHLRNCTSRSALLGDWTSVLNGRAAQRGSAADQQKQSAQGGCPWATLGSGFDAVHQPVRRALRGTGSLRSHRPGNANACESRWLRDASRDTLADSLSPAAGWSGLRASLVQAVAPPRTLPLLR